jgi:hypothetical protein
VEEDREGSGGAKVKACEEEVERWLLCVGSDTEDFNNNDEVEGF